jgi:hypothetical protein
VVVAVVAGEEAAVVAEAAEEEAGAEEAGAEEAEEEAGEPVGARAPGLPRAEGWPC